jgi:hypothetical protein
METVTSGLLRHPAETFIAALVCFVAIAALGASPVRAQSNAAHILLLNFDLNSPSEKSAIRIALG